MYSCTNLGFLACSRTHSVMCSHYELPLSVIAAYSFRKSPTAFKVQIKKCIFIQLLSFGIFKSPKSYSLSCIFPGSWYKTMTLVSSCLWWSKPIYDKACVLILGCGFLLTWAENMLWPFKMASVADGGHPMSFITFPLISDRLSICCCSLLENSVLVSYVYSQIYKVIQLVCSAWAYFVP